MKKLAVTVVIIILSFFLTPGTTFAWDDCPKGLVNDPYPGECVRYIDTDNDGICDHSQPAPEDRETSTQSADAESDNSQKLFPTIGIVFIHLIGILTYVAYKKRKTE